MAINDYFNTDTQEEKKKTTKMSSGVNSYFDVSETVAPKTASAKEVIETTAKETRVPASAPTIEAPKEKTKVGKFLSSAAEKTGNFLTSAYTKVADFMKPTEKQMEADFSMKQIMYGKGNTYVKDPVSGKMTLTNPLIEEYKLAKTPEEKAKVFEKQDAEAPLIKFLNSETGKKITSTIAEKTSDVPLKAIAKFKAIGDDIMDGSFSQLYKDVKGFGLADGSENYKERLAEQMKAKSDPTNTRFENILYGVQDSGIQSAIGALLAVGVSTLARNPKAGQAVSLPYFAAISAEGQREDKGRVYSAGNLAIDTIGDSIIGGFAENALKSFVKEGGEAGVKEFAKQLGKGFLVEGTTEPAQTFLKYGNDYKNAKTDAERQAVVAELTQYVNSGAMVDEFLIGGISGAGITGAASGVGKVANMSRPEVNVTEDDVSRETPPAKKGTVTSTSNTDFTAARDEAQTLQQHLKENPTDENAQIRLAALQDSLTDYQTVVKQRPVFITDAQSDPIATIETVQYPDGKFTYSISADTGVNSLQSPFIEATEYKTQKEAIEAGKKEIMEWASAQFETAEQAEQEKLTQIMDELKGDKPTTEKAMQEKAPKNAENKGQNTEQQPLAKSNTQETAPASKKQLTSKLSTNVTKAPVGYNVQEYSREGERVGKKKVRFERSKKTGKTSLVVYNEDGTRVSKTPVERLKKQFGTNDKAKLADYAVNGKLDTRTGKYTLNQSNAPVSKPTPKQIEKKPVVTKGEVKQSRAFSRVQERLGEFADTDTNYNKLNLAKDTANAIEFVEQYPKEAKKIALGMMSAPEGITETAISIALAEKAAENGDYALQAQLERSRSLRQTRRGQEIVSERGRFNENSPHFFIQQVLQARMEAASRPKFRFAIKKGGKEGRAQQTGVKIEQGAESVKRAVKAKLSPIELAQDIINELTC